MGLNSVQMYVPRSRYRRMKSSPQCHHSMLPMRANGWQNHTWTQQARAASIFVAAFKGEATVRFPWLGFPAAHSTQHNKTFRACLPFPWLPSSTKHGHRPSAPTCLRLPATSCWSVSVVTCCSDTPSLDPSASTSCSKWYSYSDYASIAFRRLIGLLWIRALDVFFALLSSAVAVQPAPLHL